MKHKYVIIVAGGKGIRMGSDIPKQFLILNNKPVLMHTIEAFYNYDSSIEIILVLPTQQQDYWNSLCNRYEFSIRHQIANGGDTRFHSVKNGLSLVKKQSVVAIHDGVRPLVNTEVIRNVFIVAEKEKAAYPVIPVIDSLRKLNVEGGSTMVNRSEYCLVQTPQIFLSELILSAYETEYSDKFTDDVSVVENYGDCIPVMVEGNSENIKITNPTDLIIAESMLMCRN